EPSGMGSEPQPLQMPAPAGAALFVHCCSSMAPIIVRKAAGGARTEPQNLRFRHHGLRYRQGLQPPRPRDGGATVFAVGSVRLVGRTGEEVGRRNRLGEDYRNL